VRVQVRFKHQFVLIFLVLVVVGSATAKTENKAEDTLDPRWVLAVAKNTGSCGIMQEMISFQQKTKMQGGDDFVTRFLQTESARRGIAVNQMFDECNDSIAKYGDLWQFMDPQSKQTKP